MSKSSSKRKEERSTTRRKEESSEEEEDSSSSSSSSSSSNTDTKKHQNDAGNDVDVDVVVEKSEQRTRSAPQHDHDDDNIDIDPSTLFENLPQPGLSSRVLKYLKQELGFTRMTPVQTATIPLLLLPSSSSSRNNNKYDVVVQAVTGSGKTLAFVVPVVEKLLSSSSSQSKSKSNKSNNDKKNHQINALILSPTRELAKQTHAVAKALCEYCKLPLPLLLVGGGSSSGGGGGSSGSHSKKKNYHPVSSDISNFYKLRSDIVIGTPGRVQDVLTKHNAVIDTTNLDLLILDEADVLLNKMGFAQTIETILSKLPKSNKRIGLFSATTSNSTTTGSSLKEWVHRLGMRNPIYVDVAVTTTTHAANKTNSSTGSTTAAATAAAASGSKDEEKKQQATPTSLTNYYQVCGIDEKLSKLVAFLESRRSRGGRQKCIVFFLTCACVEFYGNALKQIMSTTAATAAKKSKSNKSKSATTTNTTDAAGSIHIELLHGKMVQKRREKTMERFRQQQDDEGDDSSTTVLFCTDVASRGLDVNDIDWVVQFDAPQDPNAFVHRVGRSARAGKCGSSLIFLSPKEESYVELLRLRKVPLQSYNDDNDDHGDDGDDESQEPQSSSSEDSKEEEVGKEGDNNNSILSKVRNLVLHDRDLLEKGTKAYTSYIRAYKEHHCAFIFRFASLDLGLLATSFCLLKLPKMPELRDVLQKHKGRLPRFVPAGREIDIFAIPYKDKVREKARQKRLKEELAAGGKNAKLIRAEKKRAEKERKVVERREAAVAKGRNPDKKRGKRAQLNDEWNDLAKEERLYKKLRRGKITQQQFDDEMHR